MRFLVTGGTGFVGSHMVERVLSEGGEVICPVRNPAALGKLEGINAEAIPLEELEDRVKDGPGFDYVIHVAGATRGRDIDEYRRANVDYVHRLLELVSNSNLAERLKRFVLVSSQAVGGPCPDHRTPVRECDSPLPISSYGRSKLEAEELTLCYATKIPVTIVRPSTVFGPRDEDVLGVFRAARFRIAACLAGPDRLVSLIYVEDLADGILRAALSPAAAGQTYFMANPEPVVWREFSVEVARVMGYKAFVCPIPIGPAKAVAAAGDLVARFTKKLPLFRSEKLEEMRQIAWVCSTEKAHRELNWQPATPLGEAIEKTARWYREHGWI